MSKDIQQLLRARHKAPPIERSIEADQIKGRRVEVVVAFDSSIDKYRAHAYLIQEDGARKKLDNAPSPCDDFDEAFREGWRDVESHIPRW